MNDFSALKVVIKTWMMVSNHSIVENHWNQWLPEHKTIEKIVIFMVVPIWDSRTVPFHYGVVEMMTEMEIMTLSYMIASLTTVPWYLYLGKIIKNIDFNVQLVKVVAFF